MSKNYTLTGIGTNVEIGNGGPRVKNDAGALQIRDPDDTALEKLQVDDGVSANDVATKGQLDAVTGVQIRKVDFAFDTSSPFNISSAVPANSTVIKFVVNVKTIFDGTTPQLDIGDAGDADRIAADTENDLTTLGVYTGNKWVEYASSTQLTGTLTLSGATQGEGSVLIQFIE